MMRALEQQKNETLKLTSQVVHDLGTPLSVLRIVPPMIADATSGCLECSKHLGEPLEALALSTQTIQRVSAGLLDRRKQIYDVGPVKTAVTNATALVRKSFPDRTIDVQFSTQNSGPIVEGLTRVLTNLVKNAIEASDVDSPVLVSLHEDGGTFILTIRDSGHGIPKTILKRIFSGEVTTTKPNGNGLGLFGMMDWAKAQSFRYNIDSIEGRGTTISLFIQLGVAPCPM
jgi:signal transduction histidine kinase